jgi:hypothetical protein
VQVQRNGLPVVGKGGEGHRLFELVFLFFVFRFLVVSKGVDEGETNCPLTIDERR